MAVFNKKWTESETNNLIKDLEYYTKDNKHIDWNDLSEKYGVKESSLKNRLAYLGYRWKNPQITIPKYSLDETYFETIDTPEKAYWFGFLYADGSISNEKSVLYVSQCNKNKELLEKFVKAIKSDVPIRPFITKEHEIRGKIVKSSQQFVICLYNKKLITDLINLGCVPRKTLKKEFPAWLKPEFYRDYIRGYFDGNGSISSASKSSHFSICSMENHLLKIKEILEEKCKIVMRINSRFEDSKTKELVTSGKNNIIPLFHYLYDNATSFLQRKYDIFNEIISSGMYSHWTKQEEQIVINTLQNGRLDYNTLTSVLKRSKKAIKNKSQELKQAFRS